MKCLEAFRQVLPPEAAEKSGVAHASAESMRRVLVAAEHLGNELDDFFGDLSAGKEAYLEKPLDLLAAFKAALWLDQLCEETHSVWEDSCTRGCLLSLIVLSYPSMSCQV